MLDQFWRAAGKVGFTVGRPVENLSLADSLVTFCRVVVSDSSVQGHSPVSVIKGRGAEVNSEAHWV